MPADYPLENRPTVRSIAIAVGLSFSTVAKALRHDPRIPEGTRERVQKAAAVLGYRPDPQVAKLMRHLQARHKPKFISTIYGLTSFSSGSLTPYYEELFASAKARAEALGHGFELAPIPAAKLNRAAFTRMLRMRGVDGVLILPVTPGRDVTNDLDWDRFSVVTATLSVQRPEFHVVVPDHFGNMFTLCHQLTSLRYKRLGLAINNNFDVLGRHSYPSAIAWYNAHGNVEAVRPMVLDIEQPKKIIAWYRREKPDVIITSGRIEADALVRVLKLQIPGAIGIAVANTEGSPKYAGICERPVEIGAAAIDLLHAKILAGEKGIPKVPTRLMVPGFWSSTASVRSGTTMNGGATMPPKVR